MFRQSAIGLIILIWYLYSALRSTQRFYLTDMVTIEQSNYVAAAESAPVAKFKHTEQNIQIGNMWLSHGSFAQFSNEPWG